MAVEIESLNIGGTTANKALVLSNANCVRALSVGSNWNELAIFAGMCIESDTSNPTTGTKLAFGLCDGSAFDSGSGHHFGFEVGDPGVSWSYTRPYSASFAGGHVASSSILRRRENGVVSNSGSALNSAATRAAFPGRVGVEANTYTYDGKYVGLALFFKKDANAWKIECFRGTDVGSGIYGGPERGTTFTKANLLLAAESGSLASAAGILGVSNSEFVSGFRGVISPSSGAYSTTFGNVTTSEATYGALDSVFLHWNRSSSKLVVFDVVVAKFA